jgi:hypothetical protein
MREGIQETSEHAQIEEVPFVLQPLFGAKSLFGGYVVVS